jgi:hypothetical protein
MAKDHSRDRVRENADAIELEATGRPVMQE